MKKLCIVAFVYGEKYQDFIPLYLLAVGTSYPQYDVRIYIDNELTPAIKSQLETVSGCCKNYTIIEHYADNTRFNKEAQGITQIQRCQRWLFFDEAFLEYEAVYTGDIDLLIFKDTEPLFEQHIKHCDYIGSPYSNISRAGTGKRFVPKLIARNFIKFGPAQALSYYFNKQPPLIKLSGLHFVKSKPYFEGVNSVTDSFYKELNLLAQGKSSRYNLCSFNNEAMLRDLVLDAGFKDCEDSTGKPYNIEENPQIAAFRPHHGIHLGIFRSPLLVAAEESVISSPVYKNYYRQYTQLKELSEYAQICGDFSDYLKGILKSMESYYGEAESRVPGDG